MEESLKTVLIQHEVRDDMNAPVLHLGKDSLDDDEATISWELLCRGFLGVAVATEADHENAQKIIMAISKNSTYEDGPVVDSDSGIHEDTMRTLRAWYSLFSCLASNEGLQHHANLALAFAFLCQSSRTQHKVQYDDLDFVWSLVHQALDCPLINYTVSCSAQGFMAIPLWSITKDGNIDDLFRFYVWLPDGNRGASEYAVHAHQCFAQRWILAGKGTGHTFDAETAEEADATHAEFGIAWTDSGDKKGDSTYKVHQTPSTIANLEKCVRLTPRASKAHCSYDSYAIPAGIPHRSEVAGDAIHSTLFLFDASQGFVKDAPVFGPVDRTSSTQKRDPAGETARSLSKMVQIAKARKVTFQASRYVVNGRNG